MVDNASTTTFANNWFKEDYTDLVQSVAGRTGAVVLTSADLTDAGTAGKSVLAAATYAAIRQLLNLVAGTDVQAYSQLLTALSALTTSANKGLYFTDANTPALFDLTSAGRALLDDADAAAQRTTLGLGTMATQDASSVTITGGTITGVTIDGGTI